MPGEGYGYWLPVWPLNALQNGQSPIRGAKVYIILLYISIIYIYTHTHMPSITYYTIVGIVWAMVQCDIECSNSKH